MRLASFPVSPRTSRAVLLLLVVFALLATSSAQAFLPFLKRKSAPVEQFAQEPAANFEVHLRVQVYLDRQGYGPGKLDGAIGQFTRRALEFYNVSRGHAANNWWPVLAKSAAELDTLYVAYRIQPGDLKFVNAKLPAKPEDQEGQEYLAYRSLAEFVAERFHTDTKTLKRLNPGRSIWGLKPGDVVIAPNVIPFQVELIAKDRRFAKEETLSNRTVIVDTKARMVSFHDPIPATTPGAPMQLSAALAAYPITPGKEKFIPYGTWKVKIMITTPEFRWDKKMLEEGERSDDYFMLPPGPNSPVGIFWAGLTKSGIGLHGTSSPETIGRSESAGCIRLANWDAVHLPLLMRPGATVVVK